MDKKKISIIIMLALVMWSCSFSANDDWLKIDWGELWKIEATDDGLKIDGGKLWKLEATDDGLKIDSGKLWKLEATDDGLNIDGWEITNSLKIDWEKIDTKDFNREMSKIAGQAMKDIKKNNSSLSKNFINIKDLEKEKLS